MLKKILLISLFIPQIALAGFALNPAWGIYKQNSDSSVSHIELRLGYRFDFGLYLGAFYDLGSQKFIEDAAEYYAGPTVGYEWRGIYGLASYIINGQQDLKSGGVKYSGATGYQATLGYRALIAQDVYFGPELTFRQVEFDNEEIQGIGAPTKREDSVIIPAIAFLFAF